MGCASQLRTCETSKGRRERERTHLCVPHADQLAPSVPCLLRRLGRARALPERRERVARLDALVPPRAARRPSGAHGRRRRSRGRRGARTCRTERRRRRPADRGPRAAHDAPVVAEDDWVDADAEARVRDDVLERRRDGRELGLEVEDGQVERDEDVLVGLQGRARVSSCARVLEAGRSERGKRTHDPGQDELEPAHVRDEDLGEHLLVVAKNALEVQRVVGLLVGKRPTQAAEVERHRGRLPRSRERLGERRRRDARRGRAVAHDRAARLLVERLGAQLEVVGELVDLRGEGGGGRGEQSQHARSGGRGWRRARGRRDAQIGAGAAS